MKVRVRMASRQAASCPIPAEPRQTTAVVPELPPREAARQRLGLSADEVFVALLGHLEPGGQQDEVLQAVWDSRRTDVLWGHGGSADPQAAAMMGWLVANLHESFRRPLVSPNSLWEAAAAADIACLLGPHEGREGPLAAIAGGVPIIAPARMSRAGFVEDSNSLVYHNESGLRDAVARLLADGGLRSRLAAASRRLYGRQAQPAAESGQEAAGVLV